MRIRSIAEAQIPPNRKSHFRISGTYESGAGSVPNTQAFPLTGFVLDDIITFSVSFHVDNNGDDQMSMTSWTGQYLPSTGDDGTINPEDPPEELKTLWHLVRNLADGKAEEEYGWVIAWSGSDTFRKTSQDPDAA